MIDDVRRRRTPDEPLHVTAILILAQAGLDRGGEEQMELARAGWAAVRAEGATDRFPSLSGPSLELVRSGTDLTDGAFLALPEDDQVNVVVMGFLSLVGERLGDGPSADAVTEARPTKTAKPTKYRTIRPKTPRA
jgi:hypothetical protein